MYVSIYLSISSSASASSSCSPSDPVSSALGAASATYARSPYYIPHKGFQGPVCSTVSFHNFKSQNFKLRVSNPKSKHVAYLSVLSRISNCQGLGRKKRLEISKTDRMPRPWHIEIRHRVKKTSTINLFGFETLKSKIRRLKSWKPTVCSMPRTLGQHGMIIITCITIIIDIYIYIYIYREREIDR